MQADLLEYLTDKEKVELKSLIAAMPAWIPDPDNKPQCAAYESKAQVIGYGGAAGGGKTDLLIGFAGTKHYRSVIFRRVFPLLEGIEARSREVFNPLNDEHLKDRYNESLHRWNLKGGATVRFAAVQFEKDKQNFQGRPFDFYGFDEATEFTESQVRFITGWNRSTRRGQECRVVLTFNPPMDDAGEWVVRFFAPWLDETHSNPAKDGELRWFAMVDGEEKEVDSAPFEYKGEIITPKSRTFFHAKLSDNVILQRTGYAATIDAMPEPLRSILKGKFGAYKQVDPFQIIPTAWVRAAQKRWLEREQPQTPLTAVGVDPSRGGNDKTGIAMRYDNWFARVVSHPGWMVTDGAIAAELVRQAIGNRNAPNYINVDVGGIGSSVYDHLKVIFNNVQPFNGAEASTYRDRSGKLKMRNKRAEMYWRMRDALDPENGDDLALPPDTELLADLCSAKYEVSSAGVKVEDKNEIKERIGRSPDVGEAVMMAHMQGFDPSKLIDSV